MACGNSVEYLVERGLVRFSDQSAAEVFLQGLMSPGSTLAQDPMGVFRHIFNLHARHGAILAPLAPKCKQYVF